MMFQGCVAVLLLIAGTAMSSLHQCVQLQSGSWVFLPNATAAECAGAPAFGRYTPSRDRTGWDNLTLETSSTYPDLTQAYAGGFFEGAATKDVVVDFYRNQILAVNFSQQVTEFFEAHLAWVDEMLLSSNNSGNPMWGQVGLMAEQFKGFLDGLNSQIQTPSDRFTRVMLLYVSSQGDLCDITAMYPYNPSANDWKKMNKHQFELWLGRNTHCSALVRLPEDRSDLLFAHTTWQSFTFALRIFKTLTFRYSTSSAKTIQFSSYPAAFVSTDDFHVLDSGLVVMETSLSVFNTSIYTDAVSPKSLLSWMRVMVANRLATDAESWEYYFSQYNSGTYNNQWMVVDLNRFRPRMKRLLPNTLRVVEQMPGVVMGGDVTSFLDGDVPGSVGFWPSYNIPYFAELFDLAGYPAAIRQQGPEMLSYNKCVRAQIFHQRAPNVSSIADLQWLIQYNDFQHDPISQGNPLYAIASRVDLTPVSMGGAQTFGALDAKVSSYSMFKSGKQILAWSGPTPQQPIFSFLNTTAAVLGPHAGVPETFNFGFKVFRYP